MCFGCSLIVAAGAALLPWSRLLPHRFRPVRYVSLSVQAECWPNRLPRADYDVFLVANEQFVGTYWYKTKAVSGDSKVVCKGQDWSVYP